MSAYLWWLVVVAGLTLSACGGSPQADRPPDIRYGEDMCDQCRMIVSEPRFAAAYVTAGGEVRRFDDIGDMVRYHVAHQEEVVAFWVHDYESREWLRAEEATFVRVPGLPTPMGHGIVAFADRGRAEAFAAQQEGGQVLSFDEVLRNLSPEP